ncbi:MAG: hypothetical protein ACSLFL_07710 [Alphaproteobacteria bacterium]
MPQISERGYIGVSASNTAACKAYAGEVVGMEAKGYGLDIDLG